MSEDRIEGGVKQGVGHVQDAVGGLTGDDKTQAKGKVNEAAGSAQNAYGQVKDKAQDVAGQVKDKAQDVAGQVKDQLQGVTGQARERAQDLLGEVEDYVRAQPLQALAGGIGVGVILGLLLRGNGKTVYLSK